MYNRRTLAYLVDVGLLYVGILAGWWLVALLLLMGRFPQEALVASFYGVGFLFILLFAFRDRFLINAGLGKRLVGLRVVRTSDGQTPLGYGQAFIRFLSLQIPVFQLFDLSVPYRDPLIRRFGDRWAGTRVIDTEAHLYDTRRKTAAQLAKRGISLENPVRTSLSEFARIAE